MEKPNILYEDKQILVTVKEAGMAVQSASVSQPDMESLIKTWLAGRGEERVPYLGIVHRLDQPVEGLVVFARNRQAAADLSRQLTQNHMKKWYLAVVEKELPPGEHKVLEDYLIKERQQAAVAEASHPSAKKAVLSYLVVDSRQGRSLLMIRLETGRFHQIRCQLSNRGMPIAGDARYGGNRDSGGRAIALCAWKLEFTHPKTGRKMIFVHCPSTEGFGLFAKETAGLCEKEKTAQKAAKGV